MAHDIGVLLVDAPQPHLVTAVCEARNVQRHAPLEVGNSSKLRCIRGAIPDQDVDLPVRFLGGPGINERPGPIAA